MNREEIKVWIDAFVSAWEKHDFSTIKELFSEVEEYLEGPFSSPVSGWDNIRPLWNDIVFQDKINLKVDILAIEGSKTTLHWYLKYHDSRDKNTYEMDGTYFLIFNENKKCIFFEQWWVMNG